LHRSSYFEMLYRKNKGYERFLDASAQSETERARQCGTHYLNGGKTEPKGT
jgi:hypothetical protein